MKSLYYTEICSSTNDEIVRHFTLDPPAFFGIYTFRQLNGRGQYGNQWTAEEGKNLACSFAILAEKFSHGSLINFYTAVLLQEFLANLSAKNVWIKWPNDLILSEKKIAGILIEQKKINSKSFYIIGIGINVLQQNFEFPQAGSLLTQTNQRFELHQLASELFDHLESGFRNIPDFNQILKSYNDHLFRKNVISVFEINGTIQNGIIRETDQEGFLTIELEKNGLQKFFNKEIQLLY